MNKTCQKCNAEKRLADYYPGRHHCKTCVLDVAARRRQRDRDTSDESESRWGESLYVFTNPRIPGEVKVGRAQDPTGRASTLSHGQNFRIQVNYTYERKGYLETAVHRRLAPWQVSAGPGREWFRMLPEDADLIIRALILEHNMTPD
jgi:hypothetical protein